MPFCTCCGNKLTEEANFCPNCGIRTHGDGVPDDPFAPPNAEQTSLADTPLTPAERPEVSPPPTLPKRKPRARMRMRAARQILSGVVCVVLAVLIVSLTVLAQLRVATSPDALSHFLLECDLSALPARSLIRTAADGESIVQWLHAMLVKIDPAWKTVSERALERYLDAYIKPFAAEKLSCLASNAYSGRSETCITKKELTTLLDSGKEYLFSELGYDLTEDSRTRTVAWLAASGVTDYTDLGYWDWQYPSALPTFRLITSRLTMVMLGIFAVLTVWLLGNIRRSLSETLRLLSAVLLCIGAVFSAASFFALLPVSTWSGFYRTAPTAALLAQAYFRTSVAVPITVFAVGILALLTRTILLRVTIRKDVP